METFTRTIKLKVYPDDYGWLNAAAREVNQVWNFCNETSAKQADCWRQGSPRPKLTGYDLQKLVAGYTELTGYMGADTINDICLEYAAKREAAGKARLSWRASGGAKRALGWVPFKALSIRRKAANSFQFAQRRFRVFNEDYLPEGAKWRDGCFAQDAAGDWYLCLPVKEALQPSVARHEAAGIDLGLKTLATASDGWKVEAPRFYRGSEQKIASLQRPKGTDSRARRTRQSRRLKRIQRRAANRRRDFTHKASAKVVKRYQKIVMGDVSMQFLRAGNSAKSALDAAPGMFKAQVLYKGQKAGRSVEIVSERYTTQECADCHALTGPKGAAGLKIREWTCSACGVHHDRDVCSARNMLRRACAPVLEAGGCNGAEPRRPGVAALGAAITLNEERASVRGNSRVQHDAGAPRAKRVARRAAQTSARETGTAAQ